MYFSADKTSWRKNLNKQPRATQSTSQLLAFSLCIFGCHIYMIIGLLRGMQFSPHYTMCSSECEICEKCEGMEYADAKSTVWWRERLAPSSSSIPYFLNPFTLLISLLSWPLSDIPFSRLNRASTTTSHPHTCATTDLLQWEDGNLGSYTSPQSSWSK